MNLFDKLVNDAIANKSDLSSLRLVVEKELLHHDILKILSENNLLKDLTFIGGTCLRACYGGIRLSEDLDFTGGINFTKSTLSNMGKILKENLHAKYDMAVEVSEPLKEGKVDTWKIRIETRGASKNAPNQRINLDICSLNSYERRPQMIINHYGVDMGTSGLIIQAQSMEEIYADKLIAFAFRPNRIKYRDLWDISWLHGRAIKPRLELIPQKIKDRGESLKYFSEIFKERRILLQENKNLEKEFAQEMQRFLPLDQVNKNNLWEFIVYLMEDLEKSMRSSLHI